MEDEGPPRHSPLSRRSFPPFAIISVFLLLVIASSVSLAYAQPMDFSLRSTFKGESLPQGSFDNYNESRRILGLCEPGSLYFSNRNKRAPSIIINTNGQRSEWRQWLF